MKFIGVDEASCADERAQAELAAPAAEDSNAGWPEFQTYTGRLFHLANVTPEQIDIVDIAHHLALLNRFTGATREPYSVADHSLRVFRVLLNLADKRTLTPELKLCALLHDAAEAYWGDDSRPKRHLVGKAGELRLLAVIFKRYELPAEWAAELPQDVKAADVALLEQESRELLWGGRRARWNNLSGISMPPIVPLPWEQAERQFLEMFQLLQKERGL
jgi:uncharacterized protein